MVYQPCSISSHRDPFPAVHAIPADVPYGPSPPRAVRNSPLQRLELLPVTGIRIRHEDGSLIFGSIVDYGRPAVLHPRRFEQEVREVIYIVVGKFQGHCMCLQCEEAA